MGTFHAGFGKAVVRSEKELQDAEVDRRHVEWCDECATLFGGLDIFALDIATLKDGTEVLFEINNTANGLMDEHEQEDAGLIADLVVERMNERFCK